MVRDSDDPGLRERKKDQTKTALQACAAKLFAAHGFDSTTVADIAACANVSERTFFRYFDGKEALLLPDLTDLFGLVEAALAARPADEEPLAAVCNALLAAAEPFAASTLSGLTHSLPETEPLASGRMVRAFVDFEDRLTTLVRDRIPESVPDADLRAAVVAGAALSAVRAALRTRRSRREAGDTSAAAPTALLSEALAALNRIGDMGGTA